MSYNIDYTSNVSVHELVRYSRCDKSDFIRSVELGVCVPTFKQVHRVTGLVNSILGSVLLKNYSLRVYLVDQGGEHTIDDFIPDTRLKFFQQDNQGGSGGFTRAMREAIDDGCTHLLLMDDDVTVEAESIRRVIHFYSVIPDGMELALHGAMYSEEDPHRVYEAGARIKPKETHKFDIIRRLADTEIQDRDNDPRLFSDWQIDYGAWWFFACSSAAVKQVGYPLPLFIRGDDQEYGLRLKSQGIPTVCLPGLWVLHPAHGDKISKWHLYFHWRNAFIIDRIHRNMNPVGVRLELARKIFFRWLGGQLDACNYIWQGWKDSKLWNSERDQDFQGILAKAREIEHKGCIGIYDISDLNQPVKDVGDQSWCFIKEVFYVLFLNGKFLPKRKLDYLPVLQYQDYHWMKVRRLKEYGIISVSEGRVKIYGSSDG